MTSTKSLLRLARKGEAGRYWYRYAQQEIERAANLLNVTPVRLADLLALFSPRVSVSRSIKFTLHYLQTGQFLPDVMRSIRTAVSNYERGGGIRGRKCEAFSRALMGDQSAVVLDVWMARAFRVEQKRWANKQVWNSAEHRVNHAATQLGWTPAEVQSAVWCAKLKEHGRKAPGMTITNSTLFGEQLIYDSPAMAA